MEEDIHGSGILLEISAYLTGFEKADLQGTGMLDPYYRYALQQYLDPNDSTTLRSFLWSLKEKEKPFLFRGKSRSIKISIIEYTSERINTS